MPEVQQTLLEALASLGARWGTDSNGYILHVPKQTLPAACRQLVNGFEARLLMLFGSDQGAPNAVYRLHLMFSLPRATIVTVNCDLDEQDPTYPSIAPLLPVANWDEREAFDLLGLLPVGHPDPRRLVLHDDWPAGYYPLRKDASATLRPPLVAERPYQWGNADPVAHLARTGPLHGGQGEPASYRTRSQQGRIVDLEIRLSYSYRGVEKLCEGRTVEAATALMERLCGPCAAAHAIACCRAAEAAADMEPPPRARVWRVILLEIERIIQQLRTCAALCMAAGLSVESARAARSSEECRILLEQVIGSRFPRDVFVPGGLRREPSPLAPAVISAWLTAMKSNWIAQAIRLREHKTLEKRLRGLGIVSAEAVENLGGVGLIARASGVPRDCRVERPMPFESGSVLETIAPCTGDAATRLSFRLEEIARSLDQLPALLDALPAGSIREPLGSLRAGASGLGWVESAQGEHLHWLSIDADGRVDRYHLRAAGYRNWRLLPEAARGAEPDELPLILASFGLCHACVDR